MNRKENKRGGHKGKENKNGLRIGKNRDESKREEQKGKAIVGKNNEGKGVVKDSKARQDNRQRRRLHKGR